MPTKKTFLPRVEWLPVTSHLYARTHRQTDKCNHSVMIVPDSDSGGYKVMTVGHPLVQSYVIITLIHVAQTLLVKVVTSIGYYQ